MNKNVTATILIVLAIGIYFTVTESVLADAGKVQAVNSQYRSAIDQADQLVSLLNKVNQDYNNLSQSDRDRLAKMVPGSVDNIRLIIDLNSIALKHGFSLQGVTAAASADNQAGNNPVAAGNIPGTSIPTSIVTPTLDTVNISFGVTAPYLQFESFLQDLEANLRIMDISHLTVTASDNGIYTFQVNLKTYWLRQH